MSRVHIDPRAIQTIQEEDGDGKASSLSSRALAEHERQHPPIGPPRVHRGRRDTADMSSSDKSSSDAISHVPQPRYKINKRALDVTRRLSVSSAMFAQLQGFLALQDGGGGGHSGDVKYENTYRTEAKEDESFSPKEVREIAERALRNKLREVSYDATDCAKLTCSLSNIIKSRIKENLDLPRYKLIVNVVIGEKKGQSLQMASRCLWNDVTDTCATATYQNASLFAVATIHGVYFD